MCRKQGVEGRDVGRGEGGRRRGLKTREGNIERCSKGVTAGGAVSQVALCDR